MEHSTVATHAACNVTIWMANVNVTFSVVSCAELNDKLGIPKAYGRRRLFLNVILMLHLTLKITNSKTVAMVLQR